MSFSFRRIHYSVIATFILLMTVSFSIKAWAADNSTTLPSGIWIVDAPATLALWKTENLPLNNEKLSMLSRAYRMEVLFINNTLFEGISLSGGKPFVPFLLERRGEQLRMKTDENTFVWDILGENKVRHSVVDGDVHPLVMIPDPLQAYSGIWRLADPSADLSEMLQARGLSESAEARSEVLMDLKNLRMEIDFDRGHCSWGMIIVEPGGAFDVVERGDNMYILEFDRKQQRVTLRLLDKDTLIVHSTDLMPAAKMVRVKE